MIDNSLEDDLDFTADSREVNIQFGKGVHSLFEGERGDVRATGVPDGAGEVIVLRVFAFYAVGEKAFQIEVVFGFHFNYVEDDFRIESICLFRARWGGVFLYHCFFVVVLFLSAWGRKGNVDDASALVRRCSVCPPGQAVPCVGERGKILPFCLERRSALNRIGGGGCELVIVMRD